MGIEVRNGRVLSSHVALQFVAVVLLTGCSSRPTFLVTSKPLDIGIQPHGLCLAIPTDASSPLKYWDPGKDCSERYSSVGEVRIFTEPPAGNGERMIRFDIPLHVSVAHVSLQVTSDRVRCPQTGAEQVLQGRSEIPSDILDKLVTR